MVDPKKNPPVELWENGVRKIPLCACLECGGRLNATATGPGERLPGPGDLSVCGHCGGVMLFADDMTVRGMTDEEMVSLIADTEIMNHLARQVQRVHAVRAVKN